MLVGSRMFDLFAATQRRAPRSARRCGSTPELGHAGTLRRAGRRRAAVGPELVRADRRSWTRRRADRRSGPVGYAGPAPRRRRAALPADRRAIAGWTASDADGLLPAITFIFSRAGCDAAVAQCVRCRAAADHRGRADEIRRVVEPAHRAICPRPTWACWATGSGGRRWSAGSPRTTPGCCRRSRRSSRSCSSHGLVKAVFATETLALGINMPARTVVLERLVKFNGEAHADLTPGEYTQLTGRAGRRGIDVEGHAVVVWSPGDGPAAGRRARLDPDLPAAVSSFRPSYNMAVNLVGRLGAAAARELLEQSFAQFQADRSVVGLARQVAAQRRDHRRRTQGRCTATSVTSPSTSRCAAAIAEREKALARQGQAAAPGRRARRRCERLRPGDVIAVPTGRRAGLAVVLDPGRGHGDEPRPLVLTEDRWAGRLSPGDFPTPVARARPDAAAASTSTTVRPTVRRDLASGAAQHRHRRPATASGGRSRGEADDDRSSPRCGAPCARTRATAATTGRRTPGGPSGTPRLERETEAAAAEGGRASPHSLARDVRPDLRAADRARLPPGTTSVTVTAAAERLARIWGESDLLVAECLRRGVWDGLGPRRAGRGRCPRWSTSRAGTRRAGPGAARRGRPRRWPRPCGSGPSWRRTSAGTGSSRPASPISGFAWPMHRWARGESLAKVLTAAEQNGGTCRPATSSGGAVRWSTCSTSSRTSPGVAPRSGRPRRRRRGRCGAGSWRPARSERARAGALSDRQESVDRASGARLPCPGRIACAGDGGCAWIAPDRPTRRGRR